MAEPRGLITEVLPFSPVDGPGNRFVVFLQGCNFDCLACHNPYTIAVCTDCGECVSACGSGALRVVDGRVAWDASHCAGGDACVATCPYDSTPKAQWRSVDDLVAEIRGVAPYLSGVTVSGGEATQQAPFVRALFTALRDDPELAHLTRFVDSNGAAPECVWALLDDVMDGAMIDLKAFDDGVHRRLTGRSNALVMATIERLAARGRLHEVRLLMVPDMNDAAGELERAATWLHAVATGIAIKVIGFRCHGVRAPHRDLPEPDLAQLETYAERLRTHGITNLVVV